jgi:hypothetical protein
MSSAHAAGKNVGKKLGLGVPPYKPHPQKPRVRHPIAGALSLRIFG